MIATLKTKMSVGETEICVPIESMMKMADQHYRYFMFGRKIADAMENEVDAHELKLYIEELQERHAIKTYEHEEGT